MAEWLGLQGARDGCRCIGAGFKFRPGANTPARAVLPRVLTVRHQEETFDDIFQRPQADFVRGSKFRELSQKPFHLEKEESRDAASSLGSFLQLAGGKLFACACPGGLTSLGSVKKRKSTSVSAENCCKAMGQRDCVGTNRRPSPHTRCPPAFPPGGAAPRTQTGSAIRHFPAGREPSVRFGP